MQKNSKTFGRVVSRDEFMSGIGDSDSGGAAPSADGHDPFGEGGGGLDELLTSGTQQIKPLQGNPWGSDNGNGKAKSANVSDPPAPPVTNKLTPYSALQPQNRVDWAGVAKKWWPVAAVAALAFFAWTGAKKSRSED